MKKIISYVGLILIGVILILAVGGYVYYQQGMNFSTKEQITIEIGVGEDIIDIADTLARKNAVYSCNHLLFYAMFIDPEGRQLILPGIHIIPAGSTIEQVFALIQSNPNREVSLTFPEGLTSQEIIDQLSHELSIPAVDITNTILSSNTVREIPIIFQNNELLEGFLFPDTYRFKVETTSDEVIPRFIENFNIKWSQVNQNNDIDYLSDYEILILASIIEKEANSDPEEKKIISDIFHKRLLNDIPLGANSTLNYILDEPQRVFTDYEINYESDYNTYQNLGLPPTPICNPGLDSIIAAINPKDSDYWYFLHASDGTTIYAKSLSEHEANIEKYL